MERTSYQWVTDLQQDSPERLRAIADLFERLERGIVHYLSHERSDFTDCTGDALHHIAKSLAMTSLHQVLDNLPLFRGSSHFITWAAKLTARVSVSDLERPRSRQPVAGHPGLASGYSSLRIGSVLRGEMDDMEHWIERWEDDGGRTGSTGGGLGRAG